MKAKEMIDQIVDVEKNQHGINMMYPSRIAYFQRTTKYDGVTVGCEYDHEFELFVGQMEQAIGGTIYRPTAKKILNNWFLWAYEQRQALRKARFNRIITSV